MSFTRVKDNRVPESPNPRRFEQANRECALVIVILETVTQSFPRRRVSGLPVKTNFKVPRSYSGLPFTRDAYDGSKLSPSRSLPRFQDDPFTAGHVARCVAKLHRLYVDAQYAALLVTPIHLTSARKLAPCRFRDPRQRRARVPLARTL